jgi:hypothetical protein
MKRQIGSILLILAAMVVLLVGVAQYQVAYASKPCADQHPGDACYQNRCDPTVTCTCPGVGNATCFLCVCFD